MGVRPDPAAGVDLYDVTMMLVGESPLSQAVWLAPIAARTRSARPDVLATLAALDAIRGDTASAMQHLAEAERLAPDTHDLEALRRAILLHTPEVPAVEPRRPDVPTAAHDLVMLRSGQVPEGFALLAERDAPRLTAALETALSGDASALARELAADRPAWFDSGAILAVLPRVRTHGAALAAALGQFHGLSGMDTERLPFGLLVEGSMHRDLARLAGDEVRAKRWQHLIDAQLPVLDDPDRVIALLLWQAD